MLMDSSAADLARRMLALQLERITVIARIRLGRARADAEQARRLVANAEQRVRTTERAHAAGIALPTAALARRFSLSAFELDVLHLAVGLQLEPALFDLVGTRALPIAIATRVLASAGETRLALNGLLRESALWTAGLLYPSTTELVATRRATSVLLARSPLDSLPAGARLCERATRVLPFEVDPIAVALAIGGGGLAIVGGGCGSGKSTLAAAIASACGTRYLEIDPSRVDALDELVDDAAITDTAVVIEGVPPAGFAATIDRTRATIVICSAEIAPAIADRAVVRVTLRGLRDEAIGTAWRELASTSQPPQLDPDIVLTPRHIQHAVRLTETLGLSSETAARSVGAHDAEELSQSTRVQLGLDDLVVDTDTRGQIEEVIGAIRCRRTVLDGWGMGRRLSRGVGISALFDGDPGTGKTMAAEVIAREVDLPLRRVNTATLVDKYVGETEKNLQRVFGEARGGGYILLFDEADAVFASRSDVNGANDRYANLEVNVLLQLMEEHPGITILTTNLKRNIDPAFLRRITYKIQFALPEDELRARLWDGLVPRHERDFDVDVWALAEAFPLAGGDIKSAVMRAAYRAAATGRKVGMADLVDCAQLECQANGRVVTWRT